MLSLTDKNGEKKRLAGKGESISAKKARVCRERGEFQRTEKTRTNEKSTIAIGQGSTLASNIYAWNGGLTKISKRGCGGKRGGRRKHLKIMVWGCGICIWGKTGTTDVAKKKGAIPI